ncbi:winged helix-turn-helix domain-containing protein [Candidatus Xianfuyuplasma coldseepsis]|uniref:Helix-turn-helix transcriptional regulator n=1 Tax=Candidatus Xianfuyuplasma coldseepsis TaxID=2782163 RepID=A0A7L7KRF2_9MOLU|nr:helix-turn-helix domain-containing protein [Xianfuyuplasma coldseepsis]QMS85313.1 helix-turn-helix transcriptional regulator [Xianfuyuplasma coldseepsis]
MNRKVLHTDKEVRIAFDPYRIKILRLFILHKGEAMTAKQVADHLGEPPSKINYHIKKLESIDILQLDHTENINGILAKYYVLPYDTVAMKSEEISPLIRKQALQSIQESNFQICLKRFLNEIPQAKIVCQQQTDDNDFYFGTEYFSIFINDDQFNDLARKVVDVLRPYMESKDNLNEYKVFMSSLKISDSSKQEK